MVTMTDAIIDAKRYARLVAKAAPRVIRTEEENDRALAIVEALMEKGEAALSLEEGELLDLLTNLIRDYEAGMYPSRGRSEPHEIVAFPLEQRGLTAKDLWPVVGRRAGCRRFWRASGR